MSVFLIYGVSIFLLLFSIYLQPPLSWIPAVSLLFGLHYILRFTALISVIVLILQSNYHCAIDDMDADSNVVMLNRDLTGIEEYMKMSMQPRKFGWDSHYLPNLIISCVSTRSLYFISDFHNNFHKRKSLNIPLTRCYRLVRRYQTAGWLQRNLSGASMMITVYRNPDWWEYCVLLCALRTFYSSEFVIAGIFSMDWDTSALPCS